MDANKPQFFKEKLEKGVRDIFEAQRRIINQNVYERGRERKEYVREGATLASRSQTLKEQFDNSSYIVSASGKGAISTASIPLLLRFFDMKKLGNWGVYNRQVWGILYRETLFDVKFTYRDWVRDQIGNNLRNIN